RGSRRSRRHRRRQKRRRTTRWSHRPAWRPLRPRPAGPSRRPASHLAVPRPYNAPATGTSAWVPPLASGLGDSADSSTFPRRADRHKGCGLTSGGMNDLLVLDPLLSTAGADRIVTLWHDFPAYGLYSNEGFPTSFAPELSQRYDAAVNFVRTGGRFGRAAEERSVLSARTNYFRETYAYGDEIFAPGIEPFLHHNVLVDAARALHGR